MLSHIPYCDLPPRGKRARRAIWGKKGIFDGLADLPASTTHDAWEPLTEEEKQRD
jgi:hypothetical protein